METEFVKIEELVQSIPMPQGAKIACFGLIGDIVDGLQKRFRTVDGWEEDVSFAVIYADDNALCHIYNASQRRISYCILGKTVLGVFLSSVLWRKALPFCATVEKPRLVCITGGDGQGFYAGLIRLAIRRAELDTYNIMKGKSVDLSFYKSLLSIETDGEAGVLKSVFDNGLTECGADGLLQTESALTLLFKKEEKLINKNECAVLVASYLTKVYNIFIRLKPRSVFPADLNMRAELCAELLQVEGLSQARTLSEYEIRQTYFLLEKYENELIELWAEAERVVTTLKKRYEERRDDLGFCYGESGEDYKLSMFLSPDLLGGKTLLSFIRNSGTADMFL